MPRSGARHPVFMPNYRATRRFREEGDSAGAIPGNSTVIEQSVQRPTQRNDLRFPAGSEPCMIVAMKKPRACPYASLRRLDGAIRCAVRGPEEVARKFAKSEFVFTRARSDISFAPRAWMEVALYDESRFIGPSGEASDVSFEQRPLSEGR
jgi:hypothetical protein